MWCTSFYTQQKINTFLLCCFPALIGAQAATRGNVHGECRRRAARRGTALPLKLNTHGYTRLFLYFQWLRRTRVAKSTRAPLLSLRLSLLHGPYPSRLGAFAGLPKEITPASLETLQTLPRPLPAKINCSPSRCIVIPSVSLSGGRAAPPALSALPCGLFKISSNEMEAYA